MITPLIGFLITPVGRWVAIAAMVLFAVIAIPSHYRKQGASRVVSQIETKAKVLNEKASQAHDAASRPGALDRLRKGYCVDC